MKPDYNCAQNVLYSILDLAWDNFDLYLPDFTNYKGSYTAATSLAGRGLVAAAEILPDEETRGEAAETLRIQLVPLGKICCHQFQQLKGYIRSAYAENTWKPKFEATGQPFFTKASNEDWESVKGMVLAMTNFISTNSATLAIDLDSGGANMPAGFPAQVTTSWLSFDAVYNGFKMASQTGVSTAAKIAANNAAYNAVTKTLFDDAQVIFAQDEEKAKLFVWENLQQMIDPQTQGVKGNILNAETSVFEEGVTVSIQKSGQPAVIMATDAKGRFKVIQQEIGEHTVQVSKPGFIPITQTVKFRVGTVLRRNFVLQKAP